jgi:DegV family protein with EDD domain
MINEPVIRLDGRYLYYTFLAGAQGILQNQTEINRINVFPVNDKDTGTNLASTIRSVIDNIKPHRSFTKTAGMIADAAMEGARGNSGVIFAQFLYGLSLETAEKNTVTIVDFAEIVKKSVKYIYEAIAEPVEGTMLTVIKDWAEYIYSKRYKTTDFKQLVIESMDILKISLLETKQKLNILRQNNVVDAGAKGFVVFIEGIIDLIKNRKIRNLTSETSQNLSLVHTEMQFGETIEHRFCTEALIKDFTLDQHESHKILKHYGNSAVVAGSGKTTRIHVHTNHPAELFHELKDFGTIISQKVDDMVRQNDVVINRKWNIALVTDSTCDLSQELMDYYQINMLPINLNFGENHYLDKVTITPLQFYDLLAESPAFPKTSQINERAFTNTFSHLASHYDAIIAIHLSGSFSGTLSNSEKAAERIRAEFNKPVYVVDSRSVSGSLGLLVLRTAQAIEKGMSPEEILSSVDSWINKNKIYVSVKTMKYMVKGGRVSKPKGFISRLLNIKPIISVNENGKSVLIDKAFSQKKNIQKVRKIIDQLITQHNVWNYIILHAGNKDGADDYAGYMKEITGMDPVSLVDISPVVGMNAGIGTVAVSLMFE